MPANPVNGLNAFEFIGGTTAAAPNSEGGGAANFAALGGVPSDNAALAAALGLKVDATGNRFGFNTPVLPSESALAAETTTATPITDWFNTLSSDGDGTGNVHQDWGGLQRGIMTRMSDGTLFVTYIQNNAGTDRVRLMRSPTGGGSGAWTQVAVTATQSFKTIQLRDRTRDQLIWVQCVGASLSQQIQLSVFNSAGTQVGSTYTVNAAGKGFAQQLDTNGFYYEAGISHVQDSAGKTRVVLAGWTLPQPAYMQPNTTMCCFKQLQWLFHDGAGNWTQETVERWPTDVRMDYDQVIVGANGDPDMVYGIFQGNVAMWESTGQFTPERLMPYRLSQIAAYAFDRFGVWWHNRRTGEFNYTVTSPVTTWAIRPWDGNGGSYSAANDIPEARTRQAIFNFVTGDWWIPYKVQIPKPYVAPAALQATGSITGRVMTITVAPTSATIDVGTKVIAHSLATTGFLVATVVKLGTGTGGTGTYILDIPITIGSGTISMCNDANPTTFQAPSKAWRIQIVTPRGHVKYDGDLLAGVGYGLVGLTQVASGRIYAVFLALGSDATNTNCHVWELTRTADGDVNPVLLNLASQYNSNNNPVAGNVGFGCVDAYLGGAATSPARSSNQGPIFADWHHGSKPTTNTLDILVSRRATDHNTGGVTPTTNGDSTGHKMDHWHMRVPA